MRKRCLSFVAFAALFASLALESRSSGLSPDSETWNTGVDYYKDGDATNAVATLEALLDSRTHRVKAAEVLAKLEFDEAKKPGATNVLERLEKAANYAQIALRASPEDKRLKNNLAIAVADIPGLRRDIEKRRIESVVEQFNDTPPVQFLKESIAESRRLLNEFEEVKAASTNDADKAIKIAAECGRKARDLSDRWMVVKNKSDLAVTNQIETVRKIDRCYNKALSAARKCEDLDFDARYDLSEVEDGFTRLHKDVVMPPDAIDEVVYNLSNKCINATFECGRSWLKESVDYTDSFREKFPAWAKEQELQANADTDKPPLNAEVQAKIMNYAEEMAKLQSECLKNPSPEKEKEALKKAIEIRKLLEKGGDSNGQDGENNRDKSQNDSDDNSQNNEDENENDDNQNSSQGAGKPPSENSNSNGNDRGNNGSDGSRQRSRPPLANDDAGNDGSDGSQPKDDPPMQSPNETEDGGDGDQKDGGDGDGDQKDGGEDQKDGNAETDEEYSDPPEENSKDDMKEIESLLRQAEERGKKNEDAKKARMRNAKLPFNERDW